MQQPAAQILQFHNCKLFDKIQKPMGVASWETKLVKTLPEELQSGLPSVAEIEAELGRVERN